MFAPPLGAGCTMMEGGALAAGPANGTSYGSLLAPGLPWIDRAPCIRCRSSYPHHWMSFQVSVTWLFRLSAGLLPTRGLDWLKDWYTYNLHCKGHV